jgi:hypothetical protein
MNKYREFIFKSYSFDAANKTLELNYSYDNQINFTESYHFDFDYIPYDPRQLDRTVQSLFFMAGVSYYKAYLAPKITIEQGQMNKDQAQFLSKTYQRGLGEFFYLNGLDPKTVVDFPTTNPSDDTPLDTTERRGLLIGIGGGKDSLVSVELLRHSGLDIATWSVGHRPQLDPLIDRVGLRHYWVERQWDSKLLELNTQGALNGHIPISAILACVGSVVAVLSGRRDVVVSNEQSANEPTLNYQGTDINHQYSKSSDFEESFQQLLHSSFGETLRYYSLLRPLGELRIAELFAQIGFAKYQDVFSSCNRAFIHSSNHLFWDGTCPKCAFVFMILTPFIEREKLESLFSGKNLLLDPSLEPTYRQLLGIEGDKPLECVGEVRESRTAMRLAAEKYPELKGKYSFELPDNYDFQQLRSHQMPSEIYEILTREIGNVSV